MAVRVGRDDFAKRVGGTLGASRDGEPPVPLRIDRVENYGAEEDSRFSVFLVGPADRPLRQGTHQIEGDDLDGLDLFLVPVGRADDGVEYEAAFNLAKPGPL